MQIREGIGEEFRAQAAEIYWHAFRDKLQNVLGPDEKGRAYFSRAFVLDKAFIAYEGDELLGVVGFDIGEGGIISDRMVDFFKIYGLSTFWRIFLLSAFTRRVEPYSLQMDGIAVLESARGQGVGSELMNAIIKKAYDTNRRYILLDVIDRNTRAKALYERMGFYTLREEKIGYLSRFFNFKSATKMRKDL